MKLNFPTMRSSRLLSIGTAIGMVGLFCHGLPVSAAPPNMSLALSATITAPTGKLKLPKGAFLVEPVYSAKELTDEIEAHPELINRYLRVSPTMDAKKLKAAFSRLRLIPLPTDRKLEVYFYHPSPLGDVVGYKWQTFRKGTPFFMLPDGTPALVHICGNPTRTLRDIMNRMFIGGSPASDLPGGAYSTEEQLISSSTVNPSLLPDVVTPGENFLTPVIPESIIPVLPGDLIAEQGIIPWIGAGAAGANFLIPGLLGAAALGTGIALINTGGGVVPEPGQFTMLITLGVTGFMIALKMKRRTKPTNQA